VIALASQDVGRRFGRRWALRHCTVAIPAGRVVGLVGANGAGKTTLLHLAVGLLAPTEGTIDVLGGSSEDHRARIGFVAQEVPLYGSFTVAEHLRLGRRLNPRWDDQFARARVDRLGFDPRQRAGGLSGGQRAQLALTLAMAKRPQLLVLDEPVSSLDPLARREFLADLMELVSDGAGGDVAPTVVLSSHLLSDVERVCDHLVVLADGTVRVDGAVDELLATHKVFTGPRRDPSSLPRDLQPISVSHTPRQTTMLVRTTGPVVDPRWVVSDIGLEDLVLAYMSPASSTREPALMAVGA
jgi:ABC-2 type transport system ATP-binding protein